MEILFFCICALILIFLWFMLYDSNRFVTVEYKIDDVKIKKKLSFVFVSDLHNKKYGTQNEKLIAEIKRLDPDIVLIGGDLINGIPGAKLDCGLDFIRSLSEYPIFYANGNHEHRLFLYPDTYGDMYQRYEEELKETNVKRLINEKTLLEEYNLCIYGSQIDREYYKRFVIPPMEENYMNKILGERDERCYNLLLAHNPDYFPDYASWGADLVLSGHVHGGIVRIPFGKGVLSPNIRFFPKYDGGLFQQDNSIMVLSRGLGMHTIPFRLFNPGELVFLELYPQDQA